MHYLALAVDFDGTLAHDGIVASETLTMLQRVAATGRYLILVTGRTLLDLQRVFPDIGLFDLAVVENGAALFNPGSQESRSLAVPPPVEFVERVRQRGVMPLTVGTSIVATTHPYEDTIIDVIRELGLELQVIFNKGAVMVLPAGVNKASGLRAALEELELSAHNVVALGDGENDHALLTSVEYAVAVGDAVPGLKKEADWVLAGANGAGAVELMKALVKSDLAGRRPLKRQTLLLGHRQNDEEVVMSPTGDNCGRGR